jgi:GTP1/Obg family GTP-binding protein
MPTLTLKNVPETLLEQLKSEAERSRRSLNQEALFRLERSLVAPPQDVAAKLALLREARTKLAHLPTIDDEFIDYAKNKGRA